jgi:hypothetical protein
MLTTRTVSTRSAHFLRNLYTKFREVTLSWVATQPIGDSQVETTEDARITRPRTDSPINVVLRDSRARWDNGDLARIRGDAQRHFPVSSYGLSTPLPQESDINGKRRRQGGPQKPCIRCCKICDKLSKEKGTTIGQAGENGDAVGGVDHVVVDDDEEEEGEDDDHGDDNEPTTPILLRGDSGVSNDDSTKVVYRQGRKTAQGCLKCAQEAANSTDLYILPVCKQCWTPHHSKQPYPRCIHAEKSANRKAQRNSSKRARTGGEDASLDDAEEA